MQSESISISLMDYTRLTSLLEQSAIYPIDQEELTKLQYEVERARILDFPEIPTDLVTMNSRFTYLDVSEDRVHEMTLVYPHQANSQIRHISVLAPLGAAFIGLREGQEINWNFPNGQIRRLRVLDILYQPEANGDLHL